MQNIQEKYMRQCLKLAQKATLSGNIPVGAIIVKDGKVIARAFNKKHTTKCALDHAEIIAIKKASKVVGDWRLTDCEMYVTLEPCMMCKGAILSSRIKTVYFGACDSNPEFPYSLKEDNLATKFVGGLLEQECGAVIKDFFTMRRKQNKS